VLESKWLSIKCLRIPDQNIRARSCDGFRQSSETATYSMYLVVSTRLTSTCVSASHFLSNDPKIVHLFVFEIATELTWSVCPVRGSPTCSPVSKDHILIVRSIDPEAQPIRLPSAATDITSLRCPRRNSRRARTQQNKFDRCVLQGRCVFAFRCQDRRLLEIATEVTGALCPMRGSSGMPESVHPTFELCDQPIQKLPNMPRKWSYRSTNSNYISK
jgi:hypothetical protein